MLSNRVLKVLIVSVLAISGIVLLALVWVKHQEIQHIQGLRKTCENLTTRMDDIARENAQRLEQEFSRRLETVYAEHFEGVRQDVTERLNIMENRHRETLDNLDAEIAAMRVAWTDFEQRLLELQPPPPQPPGPRPSTSGGG